MALEKVKMKNDDCHFIKPIFIVAAPHDAKYGGFVYHVGQSKMDARIALKKMRGKGVLYICECVSSEIK